MANIIPLILFLAITAAAAGFGAFFQPGEWYQQLAKPEWTPPNWLFGPVWTILYIMIAVAGWLIWRKQGFSAVLSVWFVQLALNAAWSWIMFGRHQIGLAAIDIVLLAISIAMFILLAWTHSRTAAILFMPYLAWVGYATALNLALWRLNG